MTTENALTRLAPEVRTLARPASGSLLSARGFVQRNADAQAAFLKAKAEGWTGEKLAQEVTPLMLHELEGTREELYEAALYLADEYLQDGEGILLVSRQTGQVIARITEEDVWQPPPVRREDGSMVEPLPRLRPELEGFLVQWHFDRTREDEFVAGLAPTFTSTAKAITHEGRKGIVERIRANADHLLHDVKGNAQSFMEAFELVEGDGIPNWLTPLPRATALARTRMSLADFKAMNFRFDVLTNQQTVIGTAWVREIARTLALAHPDPQAVEEMTPELMDEATCWAGSDSVVDVCRSHEWPCLPIDGTAAIGLRGQVGVLQIHPESYKVASREISDRWEVAASIEYTLWVDWSKVVGLTLPHNPTVSVV